MRTLLILLGFWCLVGITGCQNITQDEFGWEAEREVDFNSPVHGHLHIRILLQREGWVEPLTAFETAVVLDSTIIAFEERFGVFTQAEIDIFRNVTIYVVDDYSSLWQAICMDQPNDPAYTDACTLPHGFLLDVVGYEEPVTSTGYRPTQIAIIRHVYERGFADLGVYAHELIHTLIAVMFGYQDYDHTHPGAWEDGVIPQAVAIAFSRL